jgi:hypothetical protein
MISPAFVYPGKTRWWDEFKEVKKGWGYIVSVVLAPGMPALRAPEEPHLALICGAELPEPPDRKVVLALGAPDLDGWHGPFLALFLNDHNLVLGTHLLGFHLVTCFNLPDIPAFPALELTP